MILRKSLIAAAVAGFAGIYGAASSIPTAQVQMKGYITDTWCGVNRDTTAPTAACTRACVRSQGAKYAFFDIAAQKIYIVQQQNKAEPFAGDTVIVEGSVQHTLQHVNTMRGDREVDTLSISSIRVAK